MCGIAGFIDKKNILSAEEKSSLAERMQKILEHRGKDGKGMYIWGNIALVHTRLSIIDLSDKASQPFSSEDGNEVIVFSGEIYNHEDLRKILSEEFSFKSKSDTESIIYSYKKWGKKFLNKMEGMWAFALLDKNKEKITLSIDPFGIKPLYYIDTPEWFAFASELKALLLIPGIEPKLNYDSLPEYLIYRSIAGEKTLLKDIYKLNPAEQIIFDIKNKSIQKCYYWKLKKKPIKELSVGNLKRKATNLLKKSVEKHLISDAPIGLQLSGGVDSSMICAMAAKKHPSLHSFSIGLKEKGWNEFFFSDIVAKKLKTRHHKIIFNERQFAELLPFLIYHLDEPINHPHSVPMFMLAKKARCFVKVLLSGEGADEIFGGYKRYEKIINEKLDEKSAVRLSGFGNENTLKQVANLDFTKVDKERRTILMSLKGKDIFDKISFLDIKTYLPPLLLRQDKMGMAANTENRVPFLYRPLVQFAFSLPKSLKIMKKGKKVLTKPFLKEIASGFAPNEVVFRNKIGFGLPISKWLRNKKGLGRYLKLLTEKRRDYLNCLNLKKIIKEHLSGKKDYGQELWILINLEIWTRIFLENENLNTLFSRKNNKAVTKKKL